MVKKMFSKWTYEQKIWIRGSIGVEAIYIVKLCFEANSPFKILLFINFVLIFRGWKMVLSNLTQGIPN